jgi:protein gp37
MNKTNIEWCTHTWNPVTGCLHPCRKTYCYNTQKSTSPLLRFGAQFIDPNGERQSERNWELRQTGACHIARKGEIYPFGYDPTFYPHRLNEPCKVSEPSLIFVSDTGDLFGRWVPRSWIEQVLQVADNCLHHTFLFLTKNPSGYRGLRFPDNCWIGTSVSSDKDRRRADILRSINAAVRYLSIEPLLGRVTFPLDGIDWVIMGAQTGKGASTPQRSWVEGVLKTAGKKNIARFVKGNLSVHYPDLTYQDFPV